jgi:hypothetical protein
VTAARKIGFLKNASSEAVEALIAGLDDSNIQVAMESARALYRLEEPASNAIGALRDVVRFRTGELRTLAAWAIIAISPSDAEKLIQEFEETDADFSNEIKFRLALVQL